MRKPVHFPVPHESECKVCSWTERHGEATEAQRAAVWHVYEEHPEVWDDLVGKREPKDPRPLKGHYGTEVLP